MRYKITSKNGHFYLWRKYLLWYFPCLTLAKWGEGRKTCWINHTNPTYLRKYCDEVAKSYGYSFARNELHKGSPVWVFEEDLESIFT